MNHQYKTYYRSPIGLIEITATDTTLTGLYFVEAAGDAHALTPPLLHRAVRQLDEYFNGSRQEFDLPLAPIGTNFQQQVWQQLLTIPYGSAVSYLDVAKAIDNEKAVRAVGAANGQNPISIIIPCHRVIGNDGQLVGYGGGLWRKKWLLEHEGALPVNAQLGLFG